MVSSEQYNLFHFPLIVDSRADAERLDDVPINDDDNIIALNGYLWLLF
jgi:hypothetical protein